MFETVTARVGRTLLSAAFDLDSSFAFALDPLNSCRINFTCRPFYEKQESSQNLKSKIKTNFKNRRTRVSAPHLNLVRFGGVVTSPMAHLETGVRRSTRDFYLDAPKI